MGKVWSEKGHIRNKFQVLTRVEIGFSVKERSDWLSSVVDVLHIGDQGGCSPSGDQA